MEGAILAEQYFGLVYEFLYCEYGSVSIALAMLCAFESNLVQNFTVYAVYVKELVEPQLLEQAVIIEAALSKDVGVGFVLRVVNCVVDIIRS